MRQEGEGRQGAGAAQRRERGKGGRGRKSDYFLVPCCRVRGGKDDQPTSVHVLGTVYSHGMIVGGTTWHRGTPGLPGSS